MNIGLLTQRMGLQAGAFDPPKTLKEKVKVNIYPELEIDFSQLEL